jgi:hypothetical protein
VGDSDSTCLLACAWYGAFTGKTLIDLSKMEFYDEINNLSKKLYNSLTN